MDPFFALSKDHSTGKYMQRGALSQYWESMQRQYGTLKDVPRRDDPSFAKALEHRTREKEHFKSLSDENAHMHQQMQLSQQSMHNLSAENRRLYDLISSFKEEERRAPANEASHDSGHDSGRGVFAISHNPGFNIPFVALPPQGARTRFPYGDGTTTTVLRPRDLAI